MKQTSRNSQRSLVAVLAALVIPGLLPQTAHGMYDPKHGRWLQRDPTGYVDGMNRYQYVRGRPSAGLDPTGLEQHDKKTDLDECLKLLDEWIYMKESQRQVETGRHFIFVFPDPFKTVFTIGYADKYEFMEKGVLQGGHEDTVTLGYGAYPKVTESWLRAKPREWIANTDETRVTGPGAEAYASAKFHTIAFVDHKQCKEPHRQQIVDDGGKKTLETVWSWISLARYPKMFRNPVPEQTKRHWANHGFQTVMSVIVDAPANVTEALQSFDEAVGSMLADFDSRARKCVWCDWVTWAPVGFRFGEEKNWAWVDPNTLESPITGVKGGR